MTAPTLVKEADMMRAIRAAKKLGAARATITTQDGTTYVFDIQRPANHMLPDRQPDEVQRNEAGAIKIRKHARKPMEF
jgi:hypothetical protein